MKWFLENEQHIIIYGNNRKTVYFTCNSCGDTCVCCEGAKIFTIKEIIDHVESIHK